MFIKALEKGEKRRKIIGKYLQNISYLHLSQSLKLATFFCSDIQFYLLLIPYLCFISFLYLDLYVLGDDALLN